MDKEKQLFIQRCFDLARLGAGRASPNPLVGAVLAHNGRIIGEGYHQAYGQAHAEVNAVANVLPADRHLIPESTLYVSLEPCNIYGNTPPCTHLIVGQKIKKVVVSNIDHTPGVDGEGINFLRRAGIEVEVGLLEREGRGLCLPRNTFVRQQRPYIILKFAQSRNGIFAPPENRQLWLSNDLSRRLTHKWRSEADAILAGANTAIADNPQLTNRHYFGKSPCRVVLDKSGALPRSLALFDGQAPTLVYTENLPAGQFGKELSFHYLSFGEQMVSDLLKSLAAQKISILMVEGGIKTLQRFLQEGLWDEARVFIAAKYLSEGRPAPMLPVQPQAEYSLREDTLLIFRNPENR